MPERGDVKTHMALLRVKDEALLETFADYCLMMITMQRRYTDMVQMQCLWKNIKSVDLQKDALLVFENVKDETDEVIIEAITRVLFKK